MSWPPAFRVAPDRNDDRLGAAFETEGSPVWATVVVGDVVLVVVGSLAKVVGTEGAAPADAPAPMRLPTPITAATKATGRRLAPAGAPVVLTSSSSSRVVTPAPPRTHGATSTHPRG
jgi:hypothetical protein